MSLHILYSRGRAGLFALALAASMAPACHGETKPAQAAPAADAARAESAPTRAHRDSPAITKASAAAPVHETAAAPQPARAPNADVAIVSKESKKTLSPSEVRAALDADAKAFESPLELVETAPVESTLDHADIREAKDVWPAMFNRASARIDLSEFYLSEEKDSALSPSILALEAAAARGVKIRLLADSKMEKTYPETIARLKAEKNIEARSINFGQLAGGVQHAKYFVVDGAEAYEGSQNFDWRSLSQIQEMGLRFRAPEAVRALEDVFETDWALAGGGDTAKRTTPKTPYHFPTSAGQARGAKDEATLTFVASPKGWLPDDAEWDLPAMVALIDGAKSQVEVQVMTYRGSGKREAVPELEDALKRAASRGVRVTLLVAHWSLRKGTVEPLQTLASWRPDAKDAQGRPVEVRVLTIPELKEGFLPFARVAHAKYMVIDGTKAWVGTNNWERDYFTKTRNVGLIVDGGSVPPRLAQIFEQNLQSGYVMPLEPNKVYEQPHTGP
jgi:phosphatidylserine/phosphatidylglycerophosphate/cardiolipin synthase-like enzyme